MKSKLDGYQWRLIAFLSVATFFEGYDFFAIAQILPELRAEMDLTPGEGGLLLAFVNIGAVLAGVLVRQADRIGRKQVLGITIVGYTLCSLLTAVAPNVWVFAIAQLLARIFLIGEWAVAMVYAAEEFPADRRGLVIGVIQGFATLGGIVCAAVVPFLLDTPWGWRSVYAVGAIPLVITAFARRSLRETRRFAEAKPKTAGPLALLGGPWRKRTLLVAAIWGLTYICTQNAITFWKEFAMAERSFTDGEVGLALTVAALGSMPFLFGTGWFLDRVGRVPGAILIFTLCALGTFGAYSLRSPVLLGFSLWIGIYGTNAVLPVLNAFTSELFPTEVRGDAFALANNLLGRITYVISPVVVGFAAGEWGFGPSVAVTAVGPLLALVLIVTNLPETRGKELEETAKA